MAGFTNSWIKVGYEINKTRKEKFLDEMEISIPWVELCNLVSPYYEKTSTEGKKKMELKLMLKIYFLQQRNWLSDPAMEDEIKDRISFQKFLDIDLLNDVIPDETTILRFRHLLEAHELQRKMFDLINGILEVRWLLVRKWTIVDATIIKAPSSTKNEDHKRDPEMSSTKKWANYSFGMKVHTWVDMKSWLVHSVEYTTASVHDGKMMDELLHWEEEAISGDKAYDKQARKQQCRKDWVVYGIINKAVRWRKLSNKQEKHNKVWSVIRGKVEFSYGVVKHLRWHAKTRYRWLQKNGLQFVMLMWLANIYRMRKKLIWGIYA